MAEILVRGQAFADKVTQAIELFARRYPVPYREFKEATKQDRETRSRRQATSAGGTLAWRGRLPVFVETVLRMKPEDTMAMYGVPCGTGDSKWNLDPAKVDLVFNIFHEARVSSYERFSKGH